MVKLSFCKVGTKCVIRTHLLPVICIIREICGIGILRPKLHPNMLSLHINFDVHNLLKDLPCLLFGYLNLANVLLMGIEPQRKTHYNRSHNWQHTELAKVKKEQSDHR
jgi:hypothetical protein